MSEKVDRVSCYTQPTFYETRQLGTPTLLLTGQKVATAIGNDSTRPSVRANLGYYPKLGKSAAKANPLATTVGFAAFGDACRYKPNGVSQGDIGLAGPPAEESLRLGYLCSTRFND